MMNDGYDRHDILLAHGSEPLLSANASLRRLTRSLWASGIRLQRQLSRRRDGHPSVLSRTRFHIRGFAMIFGNRLRNIDLTVAESLHATSVLANDIRGHLCTPGGRHDISTVDSSVDVRNVVAWERQTRWIGRPRLRVPLGKHAGEEAMTDLRFSS
jgi:hypothetical protein